MLVQHVPNTTTTNFDSSIVIIQTKMTSMNSVTDVETYTSDQVVGAGTQEYKGFLLVSVVKGAEEVNVYKDQLGRKSGYWNHGLSYDAVESAVLSNKARMELMWKMKEEASKLGANAVIGIRMETSVQQTGEKGCVEYFHLVMYGTAVKVWRQKKAPVL